MLHQRLTESSMATRLILPLIQNLECVVSTNTIVSLQAISRFISLAHSLKNDILLVQLGDQPPDEPPGHLFPSLIQFLAGSCCIAPEDIPHFWMTFKDIIWHDTDPDHNISMDIHTTAVIQAYGQKHGISAPFTYSLAVPVPWSSDKESCQLHVLYICQDRYASHPGVPMIKNWFEHSSGQRSYTPLTRALL